MILAWAAVLVFLAAAGRDLGWRIIDNRLVISLLLLWGGHVGLSGWPGGAILAHLGVGVLAFAIALAFGLLGWMAGGDVKLVAAVFTWAGPQNGPAVLVLVAVAGLAIAILGVAAQGLNRLPLPASAGRVLNLVSTSRGVPYGVALAAGGVVAALAVPPGAA